MENGTEVMDPRPLILKRMIWDIYDHDYDDIREAQRFHGLVPDGPDGMDSEHDASDTRVLRVQPLEIALQYFSGVAAEVIGPFMIRCVEATTGHTPEIPDGFYEGLAHQNANIIYAATTAIIAHLMDTEVLAYGGRVTGDAQEPS